MYQILFFLSLASCAKLKIDTRGVDTPRGWAVDRSSGEISAAFGEGKTLEASFDSEEGITSEALMSASDSIENIKNNIDKHNRLVKINIALRNALNERQKKTCFISNHLKQLEVHVHTSLSPLRIHEVHSDSNGHWPEITVNLGEEFDQGNQKNDKAIAIDGGTIIFRRKYLPNDNGNLVQTINHIQKIEIGLVSDPTFKRYIEFEEHFGRRRPAKIEGNNRREYKVTERYLPNSKYWEEANKVIIDKVELYAYLDIKENPGPYKIFSAKPKVELSNILRQYNFTGFKQNPHWMLHAYSSNCDGWSGDHDNSQFAKQVWRKIESDQPITTDMFREAFQCADRGSFPVLVDPKNPDTDKWLENNKPFAPDTSDRDCPRITAESIAAEASKITVKEECFSSPPDDLDDQSAERLEMTRNFAQNLVNKTEGSNTGLKKDLDDLSKSGCFYDKKLTDGITVKITGQHLYNLNGQYLTEEKLQEKGKEYDGTLNSYEKAVPLYINLGFDERSVPFKNNNFNGDDIEGSLGREYTKNFTLRDINFVHLSRSDKLMTGHLQSSKVYMKCGLFSCSPNSTEQEQKINFDSGVVNITEISLYFGTKATDEKLFYQHKVTNETTDNDTGVENGLFILNNAVTSWTDYNIKSNEAWNRRRLDDDC